MEGIHDTGSFLLPFHTFTRHEPMFIVALIPEVILLCWYKETRLAAQLLCHGNQDRRGTLDDALCDRWQDCRRMRTLKFLLPRGRGRGFRLVLQS